MRKVRSKHAQKEQLQNTFDFCAMEKTTVELGSLSVLELAGYLERTGVSSEATEHLIKNQVSGRALLLVDTDELKELLHTIGDRAVVRDLLCRARKVYSV